MPQFFPQEATPDVPRGPLGPLNPGHIATGGPIINHNPGTTGQTASPMFSPYPTNNQQNQASSLPMLMRMFSGGMRSPQTGFMPNIHQLLAGMFGNQGGVYGGPYGMFGSFFGGMNPFGGIR